MTDDRAALEAACLEGLVLTDHGYRYNPSVGADAVIAAGWTPPADLAAAQARAEAAERDRDEWGRIAEERLQAQVAAIDARKVAEARAEAAEGLTQCWGVGEVGADGFVNPSAVEYASSEHGARHKAEVVGRTDPSEARIRAISAVTRLVSEWQPLTAQPEATPPASEHNGLSGQNLAQAWKDEATR